MTVFTVPTSLLPSTELRKLGINAYEKEIKYEGPVIVLHAVSNKRNLKEVSKKEDYGSVVSSSCRLTAKDEVLIPRHGFMKIPTCT